MRFPTRVDELTPELLSEAIRSRTPDASVTDLTVVETFECDSGEASTCDRLVLDLEYAGDGASALPRRAVLKTWLIQPHAVADMFDAEVRFYDEIRPQVDIETASVIGSGFDAETGQFGILMEDLRERGATFPDATTTRSLDEVHDLIDNLVRLHARWWEHPDLDGPLAWLPTPGGGGVNETFKHLQGWNAAHMRNETWRRDVIAGTGETAEDLYAAMLQIQDQFETDAPRTVLHGDTHVGNTYVLPGGRCGLLDFQLTMRGPFTRDLTYYLITSLGTEERRIHERDLIAYYLDRLGAAGVVEVPSEDDAWLLHRKSTLWSLVIGWMACPEGNYGRDVTSSNLVRLVNAVNDLEGMALADL
ncbi:MAG: phosphotransferase [Actinomycetota bacterium]